VVVLLGFLQIEKRKPCRLKDDMMGVIEGPVMEPEAVYCAEDEDSQRRKPPGLAGQPGTDSAKTPLFLSSVCKDQGDTRDDRNSTHDRRQRDGLLLFSRNLEGSDINQLLLSCIAYTLIGQSQDS